MSTVEYGNANARERALELGVFVTTILTQTI